MFCHTNDLILDARLNLFEKFVFSTPMLSKHNSSAIPYKLLKVHFMKIILLIVYCNMCSTEIDEKEIENHENTLVLIGRQTNTC